MNRNFRIYKPDTNPHPEFNQFSVFLGGSIEMGAAENWQDKLVKLLENEEVTLLNPRRDNWDSSWEQSITNPQFKSQVDWELFCQEKCDICIYYFDPNTKSPITLLELGRFADKSIVCCPKGYFRKGNVDIFCNRYNVEQVASLDILADRIKSYIRSDA